jgi:hypothetical protein
LEERGFDPFAALAIVITAHCGCRLDWLLKINVFGKKHTLYRRALLTVSAGIIQMIKPKTDPALFPDVFGAERSTGSFVPFTTIKGSPNKNAETLGAISCSNLVESP